MPLLLLAPVPSIGATEPHSAVLVAPAPSVVKLNLAQAVHMALERHPKIAAQHASLAAAQDGLAALENLRLLALVDHEIPIRQEQASYGVAAAAADLHRIEREVVYEATRAYFSVVFAREQQRVAGRVVDRLGATHDAAARALKAGARNATSTDVNRSLVYLRLAQTKQIEARLGIKRALALLREAVGAGPGCCVEVADTHLRQPSARAACATILTLAVARRDDVILSNLFTDITCLEVRAQGTRMMKRMETFAAGSDIHSREVQQTVRDGEYRPGGLPPEMPDLLVGNRADRQKHASSLNERAAAAAEATRNLIALEAENAFLLWQQALEQTARAREAAETGDRLADDLDKDYTGGAKVRVEEVINARVLASQARSSYNEYLFRQIIGLAELERVTGGGFHADLSDAAAP
jgi:outer membrane protein TolC